MTVKPDTSERTALLTRLKQPARRDAETYQFLREYAVRFEDQTIQNAAIHGLEGLAGPQAVLILCERLLNPWGLKALGRTIQALGKLPGDGGAFALTTMLYQDARMIWEKIIALEKCAKVLDYGEVVSVCNTYLEARDHPWKLPARLPDVLERLGTSPIAEIRFATFLARGYRFPMRLPPNDSPPDPGIFQAGEQYAEKRIPGLPGLLATYRITRA